MNTQITARHGDKQKILALWSWDTDSMAHSVARDTANRLQALWKAQAAIQNDPRLSPEGKREDANKAAAAALTDMVKLLEPLKAERKKLAEAQAALAGKALAPRDKTDLTGIMVDLAVAQKLAGMDPAKVSVGLMTGALDPDLMRVAATLPPVLTGVTPDQQASARQHLAAAVDPQQAQGLADMEAQIGAAENALQKTYHAMSDGLSLKARKAAAPTLATAFDPDAASPTLDAIADGSLKVD